MFHFERPMIQRIAYLDQVDEEIMKLLYAAGNTGLLPNDLATARPNDKRTRQVRY